MVTSLTQSDIDRLEQAIVSGELRVRLSDGREITYQSTEAMLRAVAYARQAIAAGSGLTTSVPSSLAMFDRG